MAERSGVDKHPALTKSFGSGPAVRIEYPREGEVLAQPAYTLQIGAFAESKSVDISIDGGDWRPCRESLGLWWYDWADYGKGDHVIVARARIADGISATSAQRRCEAA